MRRRTTSTSTTALRIIIVVAHSISISSYLDVDGDSIPAPASTGEAAKTPSPFTSYTDFNLNNSAILGENTFPRVLFLLFPRSQ